jgi:signal transduction histidine kinase
LVLTLNSYTKDPTILVDKIRVQQILSNLVQNAIKYTRKGGNIDVIVS